MIDDQYLQQKSQGELIEEVNLLRSLLTEEKNRNKVLSEEIQQVRKDKARLSQTVEEEEEFITNKLIKRLDDLKGERMSLSQAIASEEESVANTLQRKLVRLNSEKVDLENQLEAEQEYVLNKLSREVDRVAQEKRKLEQERSNLRSQVQQLTGAVNKLQQDKVQLETQLEMEEENIVNKLQRQLDVLLHNYRILENKLQQSDISYKDARLKPSTELLSCFQPIRSPPRKTLSAQLSLGSSYRRQKLSADRSM
eukprot:TRINITY_DN14843_c1_g1_i4.p2 TRINITY_DN14843_c1_g1~~TRINITY_DN14843_c1_g1_i4.p2  ORF type:complete len:253 (-),score=35.74 TRINITY_DN14843_c1_g1_i4:1059-1817(-)